MPLKNSIAHPVCKEQFEEFLKSMNSLESRLGQSLSSKKENSVVCIPSLQFALGMLYAGACGKTFSELEALLGFSGPQIEKLKFFKSLFSQLKIPQIKIANAAYVNHAIDLTPEFEDTGKKYFDISIEQLNFAKKEACVSKINTWVSKATENLITEIISEDDLTPQTQLVLLNAIYFKAYWDEPFQAAFSKEDQFFTSETEKIEVTYMNLSYFDLYAEDAKYKYVKKHYACDRESYKLYMLFVLPKSFKIYDEEDFHQIDFNCLKFEEFLIDLKLPKFEIESDLCTDDAFKTKIPSSYCMKTANFLGISETPLAPPLHLRSIIQKAIIKVDELGTEAAAVTRPMVCGGGCPEIRKFICDRPFHYAVVMEVESQMLMLFQGSVVKPTFNPVDRYTWLQNPTHGKRTR